MITNNQTHTIELGSPDRRRQRVPAADHRHIPSPESCKLHVQKSTVCIPPTAKLRGSNLSYTAGLIQRKLSNFTPTLPLL